MPGQEQQRPSRREDNVDEPEPISAPGATTNKDEVDDLLDEIDQVLESNAETFVRGFVQKGGQ